MSTQMHPLPPPCWIMTQCLCCCSTLIIQPRSAIPSHPTSHTKREPWQNPSVLGCMPAEEPGFRRARMWPSLVLAQSVTTHPLLTLPSHPLLVALRSFRLLSHPRLPGTGCESRYQHRLENVLGVCVLPSIKHVGKHSAAWGHPEAQSALEVMLLIKMSRARGCGAPVSSLALSVIDPQKRGAGCCACQRT